MGAEVRGEAPLVSHRGGEPLLLEDRFQPLVDLGGHPHPFPERFRPGGGHHEFLYVEIVVGVDAAVDDVEHGDGELRRVGPAEIAVERDVGRDRGRPGDRERHAQQGVGAQLALGRRAVDLDHPAIEGGLVGGLHPRDGRGEDGVHVLHRLEDPLAAEALRVAVAQLQGLPGAGGGARGHRRESPGAVGEKRLHLEGRVAARIEDLSGLQRLDPGHRLSPFRPRGGLSPPGGSAVQGEGDPRVHQPRQVLLAPGLGVATHQRLRPRGPQKKPGTVVTGQERSVRAPHFPDLPSGQGGGGTFEPAPERHDFPGTRPDVAAGRVPGPHLPEEVPDLPAQVLPPARHHLRHQAPRENPVLLGNVARDGEARALLSGQEDLSPQKEVPEMREPHRRLEEGHAVAGRHVVQQAGRGHRPGDPGAVSPGLQEVIGQEGQDQVGGDEMAAAIHDSEAARIAADSEAEMRAGAPDLRAELIKMLLAAAGAAAAEMDVALRPDRGDAGGRGEKSRKISAPCAVAGIADQAEPAPC